MNIRQCIETIANTLRKHVREGCKTNNNLERMPEAGWADKPATMQALQVHAVAINKHQIPV
jgi:hypothetical protein